MHVYWLNKRSFARAISFCGHKTWAIKHHKAAFIPNLTCGHESRVITEEILSQVQVEQMGFLK